MITYSMSEFNYCIIGVASHAKHRIDAQIRVNGMNGMIFQGRIPRIQNHMFDLISSSEVIMIHPGGIKRTISQEQLPRTKERMYGCISKLGERSKHFQEFPFQMPHF